MCVYTVCISSVVQTLYSSHIYIILLANLTMSDRKFKIHNYKKEGISADALRKTRLDSSVNLRKMKREEVMSKRRNIQTSPR